MNYGLSYTDKEKQKTQATTDLMTNMFTVILIIMAFSIVPASFVLFLIEERANHSKHLQVHYSARKSTTTTILQVVSGCSQTLYWASNIVWDITNFTFSVLLVTPIFFIFNATAFTDQIGTTWLLLLLYGCAVIPLMYCFTFVFETPPLAFVALAGANTMLGIVSTVAVVILKFFAEQLNDQVLKDAHMWCSHLFLLLPQYNLGAGLMAVTIDYTQRTMLAEYNFESELELYAWEQVGGKLTCLAIQAVLFFAFVLLVEHRRHIFVCTWRSRRKREQLREFEPDADVEAEQRLVEKCSDADYGLVLRRLVKVYGNGQRAVAGLSAAIERGACFGLLGVNGAGKTTTFKMLTGKLTITEGDASINGVSVRANGVYHVVGYCPQFDALNGYLTGEEQLYFYARLRGIRSHQLHDVVDWALRHMHLRAYGLALLYFFKPCSFAAHKTTRSYSGGNKRKLSAVIAMIGDPLVILLDEPSTGVIHSDFQQRTYCFTAGMDPKTRRFMWNRINQLTRDGHTVLLTTHSMEECEALCTRVGMFPLHDF